MEHAAKFISTRAKKKTSALREMKLLSKLDHERVLYFHDAFEKKNAVVIITEMYPHFKAVIKKPSDAEYSVSLSMIYQVYVKRTV